MNNDDKYYIPEKFDDEVQNSIATLAKDALKKNDVLENIIRKYSEQYHKTSEDNSASMTLQTTNENYKPIFSTIKSSGEIKSPCFSRVNSKTNAKVPCIKNSPLESPRKTNRINRSVERRRLCFDTEKDEWEELEEIIYDSDECEKQDDTDDSDASQLMIVSPDKKRTPDRVNSVESSSESLNSTQSQFHNGEAKLVDSPAEMVSNSGISELVSNVSTNHTTPNESSEDPHKLRTMLVTPQNANEILIDCSDETTGNFWYLKLRPSYYIVKKIPSISDSPVKYIPERFSLDGKPETFTESSQYDIYTRYASEKTHSTEKTPVSQDVKKVIVKTSNDQECFASIKDVATTNNPKMNKRKSVDYSEEATSSDLATEDQEFKMPPKMYKINDEDHKKTNNFEGVRNIKDHDSIGPTNESSVDENSSRFVYNSAYDYAYDSLKCEANDFIDKQDIVKSISVIPAYKNQHELISVNPVESSERPDYQTSELQTNLLYSSPDDYKNETAVKLKPNTIGSKDVDIETSDEDAFESNAVERLTHLMRNLSPVVKYTADRPPTSLNGATEIQKSHSQDKLEETATPSKLQFTKRSLDGSFQKCLVNRSDANGQNQEDQLRLRENLTNIMTPPRKGITPKIQVSKPNNIYAIQVEKLCETLKERRFRLCMNLKLFMDDRENLSFICEYIYDLMTIIDNIPSDSYNVEAVADFLAEASRLGKKGYLWISNLDKDLDVWNGVVQKIKQIDEDIRCFSKDATSEDLEKWKNSLTFASKKANDMLLLREVNKPSMLQFGTELENLIQLFLERLLEVGIVKRSPNASSI